MDKLYAKVCEKTHDSLENVDERILRESFKEMSKHELLEITLAASESIWDTVKTKANPNDEKQNMAILIRKRKAELDR